MPDYATQVQLARRRREASRDPSSSLCFYSLYLSLSLLSRSREIRGLSTRPPRSVSGPGCADVFRSAPGDESENAAWRARSPGPLQRAPPRHVRPLGRPRGRPGGPATSGDERPTLSGLLFLGMSRARIHTTRPARADPSESVGSVGSPSPLSRTERVRTRPGLGGALARLAGSGYEKRIMCAACAGAGNARRKRERESADEQLAACPCVYANVWGREAAGGTRGGLRSRASRHQLCLCLTRQIAYAPATRVLYAAAEKAWTRESVSATHAPSS